VVRAKLSYIFIGRILKDIGIKFKLRITTLIPVLLVAMLFALFYNIQFNSDLKKQISHSGKAYIHQLLPVSQLAMLHNDNRTLQGLINSSTVNPEIQAIAFYNAKGQLLAYRGGKHSLNKRFRPPEFTGDFFESKQINPYTINFIAPITLPKFNIYTADNIEGPRSPIAFQADDILGWISIDIDTKSMQIQRYQMYIVTIFITLLGLLISLSIHYFLSKQIYLPIARLRRSMKQILRNEFETQIKASSKGELGIIEQGCEHLQKQYLNTIKDLNQHIEVATTDLQQSLLLLEEKNIELSLDKKKIEEKIQQKAELIVNMSHEIRTPMNGVIGFTNVLLESNLDSLQLDYVKTIKSSAEDLLAIINDILDYSKIDAGKLQLDCIPLDIRACVDEVLTLIAPTAHRKGIDLVPSTETNVPKTVLGDPLRLKQIITNLASNAVKFTEQGAVVIRTKIDQESNNDYIISLAIIDTGIGISESDQKTLFNAFKQADTSITRRYGGSGLGLVISKKLVEHMSGRISLKSEVHKGSTFTVQIKFKKLPTYEAEKHQIHRFAKIKVICFDDNPLHLENLCNGLNFWGIRCLQVNDLNKLEETFNQNSDYNLAFVAVSKDSELQIREILIKQSIPCVLISKWPIKDYTALGAQGFLFKPPNMQKLYETIESLLNKVALTQKVNHQELDFLREQLELASPSLLIAEDNPINRMLLNSMLGNKANIETVDDGKKAVAICNSKHFNAILLDLQMPILSGLEAAKLISKKSTLNKDTPIILISANSCDLSNIELKSLGIGLCLQKPINEEELIRHLLSVILKKKVAIDWQLCIKKVSGNKVLAREFLDRFVEDLELNRNEFIKLMQDKNISAIEQAAHKLHGACCFCGVPRLQKNVANLEKTAKNTKNINELKDDFNKFIKSLEEVIHEYNNLYKEREII